MAITAHHDDDEGPATYRLNGPDGITARLCQAVGLDPEQVEGFDLRVRGGEYPELTAYILPPDIAGDDDGQDWAEGLQTSGAAALTWRAVPENDR